MISIAFYNNDKPFNRIRSSQYNMRVDVRVHEYFLPKTEGGGLKTYLGPGTSAAFLLK